jgi:hypothetical protein
MDSLLSLSQRFGGVGERFSKTPAKIDGSINHPIKGETHP